MNCKKCGTPLPDNIKFCNNCGKKVNNMKPFIISISTLLIISLLCFFIYQYSSLFNKDSISTTSKDDKKINDELDEASDESDSKSTIDSNNTKNTGLENKHQINRTITIHSNNTKTDATESTSSINEKVLLNSSFTNISASSELTEQSGNFYSANNIFDDKLDTAWVEGQEGNGIDEWLLLKSDNEVEIQQIDFYNGYQKSDKSLTVNNQIKDVEISFKDGTYINATIKKVDSIDSTENYTSIILDKPIKTSEILIKIKDVYPSQDYYDESNVKVSNACNDTCIAEIKIYGLKNDKIN